MSVISSSAFIGVGWCEKGNIKLAFVLEDLVDCFVNIVFSSPKSVSTVAIISNINFFCIYVLVFNRLFKKGVVPPVVSKYAIGHAIELKVVLVESVLIVNDSIPC